MLMIREIGERGIWELCTYHLIFLVNIKLLKNSPSFFEEGKMKRNKQHHEKGRRITHI